VTVQIKTYGQKYLRHVSPIDGRLHAEYFPLLVTGRYAHRNPNTGNIPRDKRFRQCFDSQDEDHVLVICDYSNIEMRLAAHISKDPLLIDIFQKGEDAHYTTASIILGIPKSQVTKAQRQAAKAVNFGLIYGMQAPKLVLYALTAYKVVMTLSEAKEFREKYFNAYRGVAAWHERVFANADRTRGAKTILGRWRELDPDKDHNEFVNTPVQGSGADGLKRALRKVYRRLRKFGRDVQMTHHVHDEIVLRVRKDPELIAEAKKELTAGMVEGMDFLTRVPVVAEASHGATWAEK
jgi:DNA polymerase I-like protein with 3'-5' exonuclease and polymerase domains